MKKLLFITVILSGWITMASDADSLHHLFGASYSDYAGTGLTYRLRSSENFMVKISGHYISGYKKIENNITTTKRKNVEYNLGLEYQKILMRKSYMLFYMFTGADYKHIVDPKPIDDKIINNKFDIGIGFGADINVTYELNFPGLVLFVSLGEKYFIESESRYMDNQKFKEEKLSGFDMTGSVGIGVEL